MTSSFKMAAKIVKTGNYSFYITFKSYLNLNNDCIRQSGGTIYHHLVNEHFKTPVAVGYDVRPTMGTKLYM